MKAKRNCAKYRKDFLWRGQPSVGDANRNEMTLHSTIIPGVLTMKRMGLKLFCLLPLVFIFALSTTSLPAAQEQVSSSQKKSADMAQDSEGQSASSQDVASSGEASTMGLTSGGDGGAPDSSMPSFQISGFSGAAAGRIPIVVPPGRNGMAPNLALVYNSYQRNSWVGVGWDLDMGSIQRSTKRGVDYSGEDYSGDDFVAVIAGASSELVQRSDWGSGCFSAKIEEGFSKYYRNPTTGGWEVTAKDGRRYLYGTTSDSRQENSFGVFKWCLDKVEDSNGNFMTVSYVKDQGEVYLDRIEYTGNSGMSPANQVRFYRESRTDQPSMYTTNAQVITSQRLNRVELYGNGTFASKYVLGYVYSASTQRSMLSSVTLYGSDGQTALPGTELQWVKTGEQLGFASHEYNGMNLNFNEGVSYNWSGDYNGDGKTDIASWVNGSGGHQLRVHYSTGDGFTNVVHVGLNLCALEAGTYNWRGDYNGDGKADIASWVENSGGHQLRIHYSTGDGFNNVLYSGLALNKDYILAFNWLGDFNGDGKTDIASWVEGGEGHQLRMHYSTGNGFTNVVYSGLNLDPSILSKNWLGDFNGDGKADIASWVAGYDGHRLRVHYSTGDGFNNVLYSGLALNKEDVRSFNWLGDFNGDGKTDIASWVAGYGGHQLRMHYSTGNGFTNVVYSGLNLHSSIRWLGDFNGDGKTDIASWVDGSGGDQLRLYYSNGNGFSDVVHSGLNLNTSYARFYNWADDYNGDGKTDIATLVDDSGCTSIRIHSSTASSDLLRSCANGLGGTTTFDYTPSSSYENILLPYVLQTLSSIRIEDGLENAFTTSYFYSGGLHDPAEREFRGFEYVKQTNPDNTTVETWYHQDQYFKSRQERVELREPWDPDPGSLFAKTEFTYDKVFLNPPSNTAAFVKLTLKRSESYDSLTVFSQEEYTYDDSNGNLLTMTRTGTGAEAVTTTNEYQNYGNWLWRMTQQTVAGGQSGEVRKAYFGYQSGTGNMLWKEQWLQGGTNPRVTMGYDTYGNLISEADPNGNPPTTIEYDTATKTYPVRKTLPQTGGVTHVYEYGWDARFGKKLWEKDENLNQTDYAYDVFGRLVQADYPDGGRVITVYHDDVFPRYAVTRIRENGSNYRDKYDYVDGLGRPIQTITFGEAGNSIVSRLFYDQMGRNDLTEGPFFSTSVGYPKEPPSQYSWLQKIFDYRGRLIEVRSPDGYHGTISSTFSYSGLSATATDPDQRSKTEKKDYLGRLIRVKEDPGGLNYTTNYSYNAAGDLRQVTDHMGNVTTINYDTLGRKTSMNDPDMGYWQYTYDPNGNLLTQTDAKGQTITFAYDRLNRVTSKTYSTGDAPVAYTYDTAALNGKGRVASVTKGNAATAYLDYDSMGRVKQERRSLDGANYDTQYLYDLSGKVKRITYPNGYYVNYAFYPGTGLLDAVTGSDGAQYAKLSLYEPSGQVGQMEHANGTATRNTYDASSGRLAAIVTEDPSGQPPNDLQRKTYLYTPAGNIQSINDEVGGTGNITMESGIFTYAYDDPAHKHAAKTINWNGQDYTFVYDQNGNMTTGFDFTDPSNVAARTITYDADNLPTQIQYTKGGITATNDYLYDGNGARWKKAVQGGGVTYYIGSHYEVSGGTATLYIFAGRTRIVQIKGANKHYFHKDHLGSSTKMSDASGAGVETAEYMAFGHMWEHSGSPISNYKYTDQELDPETGLYFYGARYYDPVIGRFISADAIVQAPTNPQTLNRYSYCMNNPLIYIDPTGNYGEFYESDWSNWGYNRGDYDWLTLDFSSYEPSYSDPSSWNSSPSFYNLGSPSSSSSSFYSLPFSVQSPLYAPTYLGVSDNGERFLSRESEGYLYDYTPYPSLSKPTYSSAYLYTERPSSSPSRGWGGIYYSAGGGYGSGWGSNEDSYSVAKTISWGHYIGAQETGYAEIGAFTAASDGKIGGLKFGGGFNLGIYHNVTAVEFFAGPLPYETLHLSVFGSYTEFYSNGRTVGRELNVFGRGVGFGWERGTSFGRVYPLQ